jgi:hypothetical protein
MSFFHTLALLCLAELLAPSPETTSPNLSGAFQVAMRKEPAPPAYARSARHKSDLCLLGERVKL